MARRFALTLNEYNRIYQVIHGTIRGEERAEKACVYFAIVGSYLLNKELNIPAMPVAGAFVMRPTTEKAVIGYGVVDGERLTWGENGFHMWVQTESHRVDFLAPIYREAFSESDHDLDLPRKMMQKRFSDAKLSPDDLNSEGDIIAFPDSDLTNEIIEAFFKSPTRIDLLNVAVNWYGRHRDRQRPSIRMLSNDGVVHDLALPGTVAVGAW